MVKFVMRVDEFKDGLAQVMVAVGNDTTRPAFDWRICCNTFVRRWAILRRRMGIVWPEWKILKGRERR